MPIKCNVLSQAQQSFYKWHCVILRAISDVENLETLRCNPVPLNATNFVLSSIFFHRSPLFIYLGNAEKNQHNSLGKGPHVHALVYGDGLLFERKTQRG